jgi:hypothetical protein
MDVVIPLLSVSFVFWVIARRCKMTFENWWENYKFLRKALTKADFEACWIDGYKAGRKTTYNINLKKLAKRDEEVK